MSVLGRAEIQDLIDEGLDIKGTDITLFGVDIAEAQDAKTNAEWVKWVEKLIEDANKAKGYLAVPYIPVNVMEFYLQERKRSVGL